MNEYKKLRGKVLVLGATGTLGTYFVDELVESGYRVVATGRKNIRENFYTKRGIEYFTVDITKKSDFDKLPQTDISAVIQFAGSMPAKMAGYKPDNHIEVNVKGTLNVLEYCRKFGVKKYLFTHSHSDVAGYWNTGNLIPANAPRSLKYTGDHAVYIISKCSAVDLIEHYHQDYDIQTLVFRMPTIYCYQPHMEMFVAGKKRVIAYLHLIKKAMLGERLEIWGDPKIGKDIVYVKDFNQMLIKAMNSDIAQGIYNVATGVPTSLEEQIRGIAHVFSPVGRLCEIVYCPEKPSQNGYLYDISNATKDFGYSPAFTYISMLEDMKRELNGHRFDHLSDEVS
jgi:UDP-glucose 4-epimerase